MSNYQPGIMMPALQGNAGVLLTDLSPKPTNPSMRLVVAVEPPPQSIPNDVFCSIIELFTDINGVKAAWKLRTVSRFFRDKITFYILAKTPGTNNHPHSHEDKILKPNLTQFLKYRTKNLNGAHRFIPDYINGVLDQIEGISGGIKDDVRQERVNTLCELMTYQPEHSTMISRPGLFNIVCRSPAYHHNQASFGKFNRTRKIAVIAAAAAIRDRVALAKLIKPGRSRDICAESAAFGSPFSAAAWTGQLEVINFMIEKCKDRLEPSIYTPVIAESLCYSIDGGHAEATQCILSEGMTCSMPINHGAFFKWMLKAVATNDTNILDVVSQAKSTNVDRVHQWCFQEACRLALLDMAAWFFQNGQITMGRTYGKLKNTCPLMTAIINSPKESEHASSGVVSSSVVKMLLDLGAHPDGAQDYPKANPLAKAVYKDRWSIVQLLLHRGARIEGEWSETYTRELFWIAHYYHIKPHMLASDVQLRLLKELSSRYPAAASAWGRTPHDLTFYLPKNVRFAPII